ncbi:MAG TPA: T9SS type A sorting domain-containing protein, partial [Flavobacteriales bacterium]|nr:T9SS type A sorting domain-containing protein [Flavobacteriales bacterium]
VALNDDVGPGTAIRNTAHIHFDFNPAVITNTTVTTMEVPVMVGESGTWTDQFRIAPNPVAHTLRITLPEPSPSGSAHVMDMFGRSILSTALSGTVISVNVSELASGPYLLRVGEHALRFIKVR